MKKKILVTSLIMILSFIWFIAGFLVIEMGYFGYLINFFSKIRYINHLASGFGFTLSLYFVLYLVAIFFQHLNDYSIKDKKILAIIFSVLSIIFWFTNYFLFISSFILFLIAISLFFNSNLKKMYFCYISAFLTLSFEVWYQFFKEYNSDSTLQFIFSVIGTIPYFFYIYWFWKK